MTDDHSAGTATPHAPAAPQALSAPWIGKSVRPHETLRPIRGVARYVDDLALPGVVYLAVVRSPVAHARIRRISTDAARRAPGVVAAVTGADVVGRTEAFPINVAEGAKVTPAPLRILADGVVRYAGEPVAAVAAETPAAALDAAALVEVEYDELPAVTDVRAALGGAVAVHAAAPDNALLRWRRSHGDVDEAIASAAYVVRARFEIPRMVGAPMEPRGGAAAYDPGTDVLTVWCSTQDPHRPLAQLSRVLRRPEDRLRVIVPEVGGGFGVKGSPAPEVAVAALLAMDLGRPVKWMETRRENFLSNYQARGIDADAELAVDKDGRFLGLRARILADLGAYMYPATTTVPLTAAILIINTYTTPAADVELIGVATTKPPTGPYRGAGRPEAVYMMERLVDLAAHATGLDPAEIRRRNFIAADRFPYRTPLGWVYDSGRFELCLERGLEAIGYGRWRKEQERARAEGRLLGIGIAAYVERAGTGLWEAAAITVSPDGRVVARMGSTPHGQGHETTFAQIAADALGVPPDRITVEHGDSAVVPRGVGTFGSRSITCGGSALWVAAQKIQEKAARIAAHLLEAAPTDLVRDGDRYAVRGAAARGVSFAEVAAAAYQPGRLPRDMELGLDASATFALPSPVFPSGAYVAVVEVEAETGAARILSLVAVDDGGRIVNPFLAEAQVVGAVAQGVGEVFLEEAVYDEAGQPLTTTFGEYAMPRAANTPSVHGVFVETPSPWNPLGAKGVGEAGSIAAPPAVANAVMDALAPLGITHLDLPLRPERLWRAIRDAKGGER
ncbi:MAG TPA: xanthine dehydrogenase family protein molybdopterin-binding subunit [bacterium]|nr:xanthine dehydrogenase family protein molybdopterin-binding subunit [bacterium]